MRKSSREMDATFAFEVLDKAPYVTVSFTRPDGSPYGVPLSLVRTDGMNKVRITAIRQTVYPDLMAKYENPMSAMITQSLSHLWHQVGLSSRL